MGDGNDREFACEAERIAANAGFGFRIQRAGDFVKYQQLGTTNQCPRERDTLTLAT